MALVIILWLVHLISNKGIGTISQSFIIVVKPCCYCCQTMLLLLLNYVVLRALWKIDVYLISALVNKSLYYYYYYIYCARKLSKSILALHSAWYALQISTFPLILHLKSLVRAIGWVDYSCREYYSFCFQHLNFSWFQQSNVKLS